jgi:hypothetical protein
MLPLLSLHAIAAQRGDGLHPVLLAGLQRLVTKRVEHAAAETGREHGAHTAEPTADNVTRKEPANLQQDEQRRVPDAAAASHHVFHEQSRDGEIQIVPERMVAKPTGI